MDKTTFGLGIAALAAAILIHYALTHRSSRSRQKTVLSTGPKTDLDKHFEHAAAFVASAARLSTENKLVLYAFYKQATTGDCTLTKPSAIDFVAKAKWDAWMGIQGMSREEAQKRYLEIVSSVCPNYQYGCEIVEQNADGTSDEESEDDGGNFTIGSHTSQVIVDKTTEEWQVVENEFHFASTGNVHEIMHMLDAHDTDIDKQDEEGRTMLHWAVDRGQTDTAAALLAQGAKVNIQDHGGMTPLHYAVSCEYLPLIDLLMEHGADINVADEDGDTPLTAASSAIQLRMKQHNRLQG
ncbi:acyl-CoA-binding domain-containing protein [Thraustotheca clavata]|uniref:Acyl-CoA-binding domain-containing protein n=1 Tax=Thraustotheca clavata TaxID=74557 RepID=A0A1W0A4R9_9STRA|nr:acyl-CoA-binding domain-containing protein [Thraustotheca clavata]